MFIFFFCTIKWFQVFLSNMNNSILVLIIYLHTTKLYQVLLCITNNSIKHVICLHAVKFLTIQFSISHLFEHSLIVKQFYLTHRLCATTPSQSWPVSNNNEEVLHILQNSRTGASPSDCLVLYPGHLLGVVLSLCRDVVSVFYSPSWQCYIQLCAN